MKHDYMKRQAEIQNTKSIRDASREIGQTTGKLFTNRPVAIIQHLCVRAGGKLCTGPPGRAPSSGDRREHPPDFSDESDQCFVCDKTKTEYLYNPLGQALEKSQMTKNGLNTEYRNFNSNQITNFFTPLNFTIMKKQILFLAFFVLALLAGTSKSYGQCIPDELHPAAGVLYHYTTTVTGPGYTGGGTYEWFVTTNPDIKAKAKKVLADGLFSAMAGDNTKDVSITWTSAAVALARTTPIYVALYYFETNSVGACVAENIRALQIAPVNTFLLAVEPTNATGTVLTPNVCAAPVLTAVVDNPADVAGGEDNADASMVVTYDKNTLYYKITASGVNSNWKPVVRIPSLENDQTYASVQWSADGGTNWTDITGGTAVGGGDYTLSDVAATVAGTSYLVKLEINNNNYETLADQVLNVAIDGTLAPDYTIKDIVDPASDCTDEVDFGKNADGTILARPTITPGTPPFMDKPLP